MDDYFNSANFTRRFKIMRDGKSINEIAAFCMISPTTYKKYELGKSFPAINTLIKICQYLDISPNWLIYGNLSFSPFGRIPIEGGRIMSLIPDHANTTKSLYINSGFAQRFGAALYEPENVKPKKYINEVYFVYPHGGTPRTTKEVFDRCTQDIVPTANEIYQAAYEMNVDVIWLAQG